MVVYQVPNLKVPHHYAKMVRLCLCSAAVFVTKKTRFGGIRSCALGLPGPLASAGPAPYSFHPSFRGAAFLSGGRCRCDHLRARLRRLARGARPFIAYKTRTDHSEALAVRGTGYGADRLDQPRASPPSSAGIHRSVLNTSYDRMYFWARAVETGNCF